MDPEDPLGNSPPDNEAPESEAPESDQLTVDGLVPSATANAIASDPTLDCIRRQWLLDIYKMMQQTHRPRPPSAQRPTS